MTDNTPPKKPRWKALWGSVRPVIMLGLVIAVVVPYCTSDEREPADVIDTRSAEAADLRCRQVVAELAAAAGPLRFDQFTFTQTFELHGSWDGDDFPAHGAGLVDAGYEVVGMIYSRYADGSDPNEFGMYECTYEWVGTTPTIGEPEDVRLGYAGHVFVPWKVRASLNIGTDHPWPEHAEDADGTVTFYCSRVRRRLRLPLR
jgi:hypothetical protein